MRHLGELSKCMRVWSDFKGFKVVLWTLHDFAWLCRCSPYITLSSRCSVLMHVTLPSTMPTIPKSKAHLSKGNCADPFRSIWVGHIEVCNKVQSINVPFQKPQIFFMPIPLPLHQELQLSIVELTINHLFDLIPFLPFYNVRWWRWPHNSTFDWVWWHWHEFDDMEDQMDSWHRWGEFEMIWMQADGANDWIWAQVLVCELLHRSGGTNVQSLQKDFFAHCEFWCRSSPL